MKTFLIALSLTMLSGYALAQSQGPSEQSYLTGIQLKDLCDEEKEGGPSYCTYYLFGLIDGFDVGAVRTIMKDGWDNIPDDILDQRDSALGFCVPRGGTYNQFALVIKKYLVDHPEELHKAATAVSVNALREAFPCG